MFKARFSVSSVSKKVVSGLGLGASSILLSGTTASGNVSAMFGKIVDTSSSMQDNSRGEGNTDEKFKDQSSSSYTNACGNSYEQNNIVLEEEKKEGTGFFGKIGNVFGSIFSKKQENPQGENNNNGNVEDRSSSSYSNIQDNSYGQNNICLKEEEKKEGPGFFGKIGNAFSSIFSKEQENPQSENNTNENVEDRSSSSYSNIQDNSYEQNNIVLEEEKKEGPGFFDKIGNAFSSIFSKNQENKQSESNTSERFEDQASSSYSNTYNNSYGQNNIVLEKEEEEEEEKKNVPGFFEEMKERFTGIKEGIGEVADKVTDTIKSVFTSGKKEQNENNFSNEVEEQEEEDSYKNNKKRRYSDDDLVENCKIEANDDENGELNFYKRDFNEEGEETGKHKISYEKKVDEINNDNSDCFNIISDNVITKDNPENMIIEEEDNMKNSSKDYKKDSNKYEGIDPNYIYKQNSFSLLNQNFSTPNNM